MATGDHSLTRGARSEISRAARREQLFCSAITAWEIATLARRGRLRLAISPTAFVNQLFGHPGVREVPVDRDIGLTAGSLPGELHADPADRLIIATAIVHGMRLMTRDERILRYAKASGALPAIAC